jgi:hypothetical protein
MALFIKSVRHASCIPADATMTMMTAKQRKCTTDEILYRLGDFAQTRVQPRGSWRAEGTM